MTRRGWVLFAAMCVIWGLPYLFIRVAVEHLNPATLVALRTGLATIVLLPLALARGQVGAVVARWRWVLVFAAVEIMLPWLLLSDAERHLTSSLAGLLVAGVPLVGAVLGRYSRHGDPVDRSQLLGLLVGLIGVVALVGLDVGHLNLFAVAEMAGVAVGYAVGPVILARSLADLPGLGVIACSLAVSAIVFSPALVLRPPRRLSAPVVSSVVVLALVCTALAFVVFFALIAAIGPTRATVITYVNPAVALSLGVLVLGEHVTTGMVVGFPLILLGSVLGARRAAGPAAVATAPAPAPVSPRTP